MWYLVLLDDNYKCFYLFFLSTEPHRERSVVSREMSSETLAEEQQETDQRCAMIDLNAFVKLYRIGAYCTV